LDRFEVKVDPAYLCLLCEKVLEDGVEVIPCQTPFCRKCITHRKEEEGKDCPFDGHPINGLKALSPFLKSVLGRLMISCDFKTMGCLEVLRLDQLHVHVKECPKNTGLVKDCPEKCGAILRRVNTDEEFPDHSCLQYMVIKTGEDRIHVQNLESANERLQEEVMELKEESIKSKEKHDLVPLLFDTMDSNIRDSMEKMREEVMQGLKDERMEEMKRMREEVMQEMKGEMERMRQKVDEKLIPIGFIYSQFPDQPEPGILWPRFQWEDMSPQFSGLFFRVLGQGSDLMGRVQPENSPRLTTVKYHEGSDTCGPIELIPGTESQKLATAGYDGKWRSLSFTVSGGEVRPKNMAFKLFKRIK
jgi:hypothetical protein